MSERQTPTQSFLESARESALFTPINGGFALLTKQNINRFHCFTDSLFATKATAYRRPMAGMAELPHLSSFELEFSTELHK